MKRIVVNVSTGSHYIKGQARLAAKLKELGEETFFFRDVLPEGCPPHAAVPYAMKPWSLKQVAEQLQPDLILWADASIFPLRSLEPIWARIFRDGYWLGKEGWLNGTWTAESAYPDLFAPEMAEGVDMQTLRESNKHIPHVVATAFGLNLRHEKGAAFLKEYFRLASETRAFCGPWMNSNHPDAAGKPVDGVRVAPCGPPDVRGARHDQTAASVIAWRLGFELSEPPSPFAYANFRPDGTFHLEDQDERTILCAHGAY